MSPKLVVSSVRDRNRPDLEVLFVLVYFLGHGFTNPLPRSGHGFTLAAILLHPMSRGSIRLRSSNPSDYPCIQANYLSEEADVQEIGVDGAHLRAELATQVSTLTGCAIPESTITADPATRRATAAMDGVVFQLQGHNLILLRHCAHCGTGLVATPPIKSRSDLGYALAA